MSAGSDHGGGVDRLSSWGKSRWSQLGKLEMGNIETGPKYPSNAEEFKINKARLWNRDISLKVLETWIKYKGVFDFEMLYKHVIEWMEEREFEVFETLYKAKFPEIEVRWEGIKKETGFIMSKLYVQMHMFGLEEVETIKDGQKKMMYKGRIRILMWGEVITDYPDIFGDRKWTTSMEKKLLSFLNNFIMRRDIELRDVDRMIYLVWRLHDAIKTFLNLEFKGNAY